MVHKDFRTVGKDRTATHNGSRYVFPDSNPGDIVAFVEGKPESTTARKLRFNEQVGNGR